ncbi:MAG TPA: hypothetical protein VEA63_05155, partial [Opitutus sp.]|nr:hypothetical protein [Opitutus sp.]
LWVYPETLPRLTPPAPLVTAQLTSRLLKQLHAGANVLWLPALDEVHSPVVTGMSSIFWNTAWTENQAPHTLGILCDPSHPLFADFPTDAHSNWQWQELLLGAKPIILDPLPHHYFPLVQLIDTWFENRKLGVVMEARFGRGKLLVCTLNLTAHPERWVARQFLYSLQRYLSSEQCVPPHAVTLDQIKSVVAAHTREPN